MATNSIIGSGTATINCNGQPYTANFSINQALSGSVGFGYSPYVSSSWQPIQTASVANVGGFYISNPSGPGTVLVATGSAGQNLLDTLSPGDFCIHSWAGPVTLYLQCSGSPTYVNFIEWNA